MRKLASTLAGPLRPYYLPFTANRATKPGLPNLIQDQIKNDDVVIEVGAYLGGATIELAKISKQVYAFEPNKLNFRVLQRTVRKFPNVKLFHLAVGEKKGEVWLNLRGRHCADNVGSLKMLSNWKYQSKEKVPMVSLDEMTFASAPSVLVSDCEGYEIEVIEGARRILPAIRTVLVEAHEVEGGNTAQGVVGALRSNGYPSVEIKKVSDWSWIVASRQSK